MKKQNLTREEVEKEASKLGLTIDEIHFTEPEKKSGRPKKMPIEKKEPKKTKGRPKKSLKVLELESETTDLFAELLASSTTDEDEEDTIKKENKNFELIERDNTYFIDRGGRF
jgi:hypothetical protein